MKLRSLILGAFSAVAAVAGVYAANISPINPTQCQVPGTCVDINANAIPAVNSGVPGFSGMYTAKNFLDNGAFSVNQIGTGTATGGTTSGPAASAYVSDRWAVETNVGSGAGRGQVVTAVTGTTLSPAFPNAISLFRNSGALTQPISLEQEIETQRVQQLQGKSVIMSCWLANNAVVPAGNTVTFHLFTGTGTNEGLGASTVYGSAVGMTASPALTPAMTGIATAGTYTTPALTLTSTRYSSQPIAIATTVKEAIFELDWTPGAETAGTTNGIVVQGCQLEIADPGQSVAGQASAFEFLPPALELARAQRFRYVVSDLANTFAYNSNCNVTTANTTVKCWLNLPVTMAGTPQATVATATSFGIWLTAGTAGTCTTLAAAASSSTPNTLGLTCTTGGTIALGTGTMLIGATNTAANTILASADF